MELTLESAACTHVGRRANNEDAAVVAPALGLFAVADGMGGYEGGEVASRLAVDTLEEGVRAERGLAEAIAGAHQAITARKRGRLAQMGSTLTALLVERGRAVVGHVGDSRLYRLRDGLLVKLTRDHSLYDELCAEGFQGLPPKESSPYANVITRALGMNGQARPDFEEHVVRPGDVYLLCTDGLDVIPDDHLATLLDASSPFEAATSLVACALERGARDNVTAVVVRVS
jgi:serine/threonine protein phosphatase PrpC